MNDIAIEILNKMLIKEHFEGSFDKKVNFTKEELIMFCIKLLKEINCIDNKKTL